MSDETRPELEPYVGAHDPREAERLAAQEAGGLEELRAALALHSPPQQARVLELGCGAGTFTRALLAALPEATIVATDRDAGLLARAREALAAEERAGRVVFAQAEAAGLPYEAQRFDLVACRCLLMHQPDPLLVVSEMFRVAVVGGLALAIEPDWGARALYPDSEALAALLDLARRARPYGFPDLLLGRKLYALFRAAGFVRVRIQPTAFCETADEVSGTGAEPPTGPGRLLEQGRALLRRAGLATDAELDALIARLAAVPRHPEYFSAGMDFAAIGQKPLPAWPE
jgi:SAM-dependent methyltransferase